MDLDSQTISLNEIDNGMTNDHLDIPVACGLCGRALSLEHEVNSSLQPVGICDDCKFLLLEDFGTPAPNSLRRRFPGRRRRRSINGSESFSQEFSQIINQARHIEPDIDDSFEDTDSNVTLGGQPVSSRTTPNGSRRWGRIYLDTESNGLSSDYYYCGEGESNMSTGAYRYMGYHGESDSISFSSYEGDSGTSVDGHIYSDIFLQSMERSDMSSDSDIDPMHAGVVQWDSDERGVEEDDAVENAIRPLNTDYFNEEGIRESEFEGMIRQRIHEVRELQISSNHHRRSREEASHNGNSGDYLDALEFEEFLDNLAENDSGRQGPPPASLSFVHNLPLVLVSHEHVKPDGLPCAICKDFLMIGTQVNQLPCFHLYHPSCILPWLNARNSCPLCRYELPTDDTDYEFRKRNANSIANHRFQMEEDRDGSSTSTSETTEMLDLEDDVGPTSALTHTNYRRRGWLFLAAAPIVSLAGIFFVLWLGNVNTNPLVGRRGMTEQRISHGLSSQPIHNTGPCPHNGRIKRWWWWF